MLAVRPSSRFRFALLLVAFAATVAPPLSASRDHLFALDGRPVDVRELTTGAPVSIVVFALTDCPVSNRYAPALRSLKERFSPSGVRVSIVYPNPRESNALIREHQAKFDLSMPAFRDPAHALVRAAGATIAPEAAVFDREGALRYLGRIDDLVVSFGVYRPAPTRHDLADAVTAVLDGREVSTPRTQAVGCYLADLLR